MLVEEIKTMNVIAYVRVSTLTQREKETIDQQIKKIKDYINLYNKTHDIKINLKGIYKDDGISGFKDRTERPDYDKLLNKVLEKDIDGIIATELSRISRSSRLLQNFYNLMDTNDKKVILIKENIDTTTAIGRANFGMLSVFVQLDAENTIERLAQGRAYAKEVKGVKFGRKKKIVPDNLKRKMIAWYNKGLGFSIIERLLMYEKYTKVNENGEQEEIIGFKMCPTTIGENLESWGVKIRDPKHRYVGRRKEITNEKEID